MKPFGRSTDDKVTAHVLVPADKWGEGLFRAALAQVCPCVCF